MYRYLAIVWDPAGSGAPRARALRRRMAQPDSGWDLALDARGLAVWHRGAVAGRAEAYPLRDRDEHAMGVVLGRLFPRVQAPSGAAAARPPVLDTAESERIVASRARHLVEAYWGRYVTFFRAPRTGAIHAARDPGGALPCDYAEADGLTCYFSHVEDARPLASLACSIDRQQLGRFLHFEFTQRPATALREVQTLLPGQSRVHGGAATSSEWIWDPVAIARGAPLEDPQQAARALRHTITSCVAAWASCYQRVGLRLSGGLDSTLVRSGLRGAAAALHCLHYVAEQPDSEERSFAIAAARHADVPLRIHTLRAPALSEPALAAMPRTAVPANYHYALSAAQLEVDTARAEHLDALFSGHTGDEVLNAYPRHLGALDFVDRHGLRARTLSACLDAALASSRSFWWVAKAVLVRG